MRQTATISKKGAVFSAPYYRFEITRHRASAVPRGMSLQIKGYTYKNGIMVRCETLYRYYMPAADKSIEDVLAMYRRYQAHDDDVRQYIATGTRTYHKLTIKPYYMLDATAAAMIDRQMVKALTTHPTYTAWDNGVILPNDYDTLSLLDTWLRTIPAYDPVKVTKINTYRPAADIPTVTDDIAYYVGSTDPAVYYILSRLRLDIDRYRVLVTKDM